MRKALVSVVVALSFAGIIFAQPVQTPDDRIRTSMVVPDLYGAASGWNKASEHGGELVAIPYQDKTLTVRGSEEYYINTKEIENNTRAYLWIKNNADGSKEEFAMLYGTKNVARGAIRVKGKWYVSKVLYFNNGEGNTDGKVRPELVFDDKDPDKPVKVKFFLETVEGHKEVVFDLQ